MYDRLETTKAILSAWRTSTQAVSVILSEVPKNRIGELILNIAKRAEVADAFLDQYREILPEFVNVSSYSSTHYGLPEGIPYDPDTEAPAGIPLPLSCSLPVDPDILDRINGYMYLIDSQIKIKKLISPVSLPTLPSYKEDQVCTKPSPIVSIPSLPTPSSILSTPSISSHQRALRSVWQYRQLVESSSYLKPWQSLESSQLSIEDIEDMLAVIESMLGVEDGMLDYPSKTIPFKCQREKYCRDLSFALFQLKVVPSTPSPRLSEPNGKPADTSYVYDTAWLRSLTIIQAARDILSQLKPNHPSVDIQVKYLGREHSMISCVQEINALFLIMHSSICQCHNYNP